MSTFTVTIPTSFTFFAPDMLTLAYAYMMMGVFSWSLEMFNEKKYREDFKDDYSDQAFHLFLHLFLWPVSLWFNSRFANEAVYKGEISHDSFGIGEGYIGDDK